MVPQIKKNQLISFFKLLALNIGILGALGLGISCSTTHTPSFDSKFNQLQSDMPQDKVQELLGTPDLKELKEGVEFWNYNQNDGRYVQFKNGHVVAFGRGVWAPTNPNAPQVNPTPFVAKNIGDTCKIDDDCVSKNCHFKVCSGKNNCQVPDGKVCATNTDCCSGLCDFGFCRKKR
jgi:hypothetical protein